MHIYEYIYKNTYIYINIHTHTHIFFKVSKITLGNLFEKCIDLLERLKRIKGSSALFNLPHAHKSVSCLLQNLLSKWSVFRRPEGKKSTKEAHCCLLYSTLLSVIRTHQGVVFCNLFSATFISQR